MSEDFPRPQDQSNTESNDSGAHETAVSDSTTNESSHQPDRAAQPYPSAHYNTGEYRHDQAPATAVPAAETTADMTVIDSVHNDGPHQGSFQGTSAQDSANTGPVQQQVSSPSTAAVWQPRPSGALAAEAWSSPTGTGSYPSGAGAYGNAQHRPENPWAPPATGQLFTGAQPTGQFGGAPYAAYGQAAGFGYAGMPPAPPAAPVSRGTDAAPRKGRKTVVLAAAVVLALAAAFGAGALGAQAVTNNASATDSSLSQQTTSPVVSDSQPVAAGSVEAVAAKLLPSVVSILSVSSSEEAEGSGVILSSDGLILTNNHVIAGATTLTVKFNDGTTATAKVIGSDATDDLAVIKVSGVSGLTVATLGSSANVKVGEQVVAVGSPLGLSATVTSGIVSALNRPVRTAAEDTQGQQDQGQGQLGQGQGQLGQGQSQDPTQTQTPSTSQDTVLNAIQTDAAINPGNSGGALVDMSGAVIGINSAIASLSSGSSSGQSGSIGVGFAIPIDQAHRIAQEIINTGHATHAVLGASVGDAADGTSATAQAEAEAGLSVGAKIASVTSGGGAAAAGLQANDVITKIGGTPVGSADALIATIRSSNPGSKVVVTYLRGSDTKTATVTLGSAVSN